MTDNPPLAPPKPVMWRPSDRETRAMLVEYARLTRRSLNSALDYLLAVHLADELAKLGGER